MADEIRVILVKPGDVLLIGNLGDQLTQVEAETLTTNFRNLGFRGVALFTEDIDISRLPAAAAPDGR